MENQLKPFRIVTPGEMIAEMLGYMGWTQSDLAEITGLSDKTVSKLISNSQNITTETASLLSQALGKTPKFWLNLSANFQLSKKDEDLSAKEKKVRAKALMHKVMPVSEMKKLGWFVNDVSTVEGIENEYERIFGSREFPREFYNDSGITMAARQTRNDTEYTDYYRKTWFAFAKYHAANIRNRQKYDKNRLQEIASRLYSYTTLPDGEIKILNDLSCSAGVNFFVLSHLPKTYLDGAAFVQDEKPFIVYTGRYNRDDNFWFVLAHEIAHVLLHFEFLSAPSLDDLESKAKDKREEEADFYAGKFLNQQKILQLGRQMGRYVTEERLMRISHAADVSSSVALGTLQHNGIISWKQFAKCKQKVLDKIPAEYIRG